MVTLAKIAHTSQEVDILSVDAHSLAKFGWDRVISTEEASNRDLKGILDELDSSRFSHSWRGYAGKNSENLFENILVFENEKRPTKVFFYYGVAKNGRRDLLGCGAISTGLSHDFPIEGFPVISRGYILAPYRQNRFYYPILAHRCQTVATAYGEKLNGIHLGSSNIRVYQSIKNSVFGMPFTYLGLENLLVTGEACIVRDFFMPSPYFLAALAKAVSFRDSIIPSDIIELMAIVREFIDNNTTETSFFRLKTCLAKSQKSHGDNLVIGQKLLDFVEFMNAIPILETMTPIDIETTHPTPFSKRDP